MTASYPQIPLFIQNDSGMTIPPRSVVIVTFVEITDDTPTSESMEIWHVEQYSGQPGNILVTGISTIPPCAIAEIDEAEVTDEEALDEGEESDEAAESDEIAEDDEVEEQDEEEEEESDEPEGWWSPDNSYGVAYADQRIYVSIDTSIEYPQPGEEWGPVPGQWYISRGGHGFFADGYPYIPSGSDSSSGGLDPQNIDTTCAIFARGTASKTHWAVITSKLSSATFASPTTCTVDVWLPAAGTHPAPLAVATNNALLGLTVTNRGCYSVAGGNGSGSSSSSSVSAGTPCLIQYDDNAGEWILMKVFGCTQVVEAVWCDSSGLNVTYGSVTG